MTDLLSPSIKHVSCIGTHNTTKRVAAVDDLLDTSKLDARVVGLSFVEIFDMGAIEGAVVVRI
jgi:hypothetical protein